MNIVTCIPRHGAVYRTALFLFMVALPLLDASSSERKETVFQFAEWKTQAAVSFPTENTADGEDTPTVSGSAGLRLRFKDADFRCYTTMQETGRPSPSDFGEARAGAAITLFPATAPLTLKGGSLSFARSLSRLKSPSPGSTLSPLRSSFSVYHGIGAALPTLSSSVQPEALALQWEGGKLLPGSTAAEGAVTSSGTAALSLRAATPLSKHTRTAYALTVARFDLESSSTLKKAGAAFDDGCFSAALAEAALLSPLLKLHVRAAIHQSPYGGHTTWLQGAARTGAGAFQLDAGAFCVPDVPGQPEAVPLVGGDSSVCRVRKQVSLNPQVLLLPGDRLAAVRAGAEAVWQERVAATKYADRYETHKLGAALSLETGRNRLKVTASAVNTGTRGAFHTVSAIPERYYGGSASWTLSSPLLRLSLTADAKHYPAEPLRPSKQEKQAYAFRASASPGKARRLTVQASGEAVRKDGARTSGKLSGAASVKLGSGRVRTQLKCAVELPI